MQIENNLNTPNTNLFDFEILIKVLIDTEFLLTLRCELIRVIYVTLIETPSPL